MTAMKSRTRHISKLRKSPSSSQRGVVLVIALIVLVAMTLAAVGMSRSIDTANVVAGNMGFKQATMQSADLGTNAAYAWLVANSAGTTLQNDNPAQGYFSSRPAGEPNWFNSASWGNAVQVNGGTPDAAGNVASYMIHRMCTLPGTAYNGSVGGVANQCALAYPTGGATTGGSMAVGSTQFQGLPQIYYRVTTRVDGPRNTVSITQVSVLIQI
jgi:type IV pilus assembly protein PilX